MVRGRIYPWVALAVLTALYTAAFVDRQVLNLLVDPIKASLDITDGEFSLLQGLAFMVSFAFLSPLAGRLVDRTSRRMLLVLAGILWSACTVACGLSNSFIALFIARVGIGASEAFVTPAGWSLLADTFDRRRLPRALSLFLMGPYVGGGLAMIFGGLLIHAAPDMPALVPPLAALEPWQRVFVVIGTPGILLALLALMLREPRRQVDPAATRAAVVPLSDAIAFLRERRGFFGLFSLAMAGIDMTLYALPAWMPAALIRAFHGDPARTGIEFGMVALASGMAGVLSGPLCQRLLVRAYGERAGVMVACVSAAGLFVTGILLLIVRDYVSGLIVAGLATFLFTMPQATTAAALQIASPAGMRGLVSALYTFIVAIVGLAVAPTVVALLTDHLFADPTKVHYSLAIVMIASSAVALVLARSAAPYFRPLDSAQGTGEGTVVVD